MTSLTALPKFWFSVGQHERHFLVGVEKKALRPTMVSKIHLPSARQRKDSISNHTELSRQLSALLRTGEEPQRLLIGPSLAFIFRFSDEIFSYKVEISCLYKFFGVSNSMSHVKFDYSF